MIYYVKREYAPNVLLTPSDNLFEVLDHLVAASHAVVPPSVGVKSFFGLKELQLFMRVYADNPKYKCFEVTPYGIVEVNAPTA
ncbi:hypothetical protein ACE41H_21290 [Paenibacillus enshidis]|uniref:Uncharacterized protein n=1 Tax=Paenibacillus enshidis TaxID=1458439 RepID=A0ABV5AZI5_9BACL